MWHSQLSIHICTLSGIQTIYIPKLSGFEPISLIYSAISQGVKELNFLRAICFYFFIFCGIEYEYMTNISFQTNAKERMSSPPCSPCSPCSMLIFVSLYVIPAYPDEKQVIHSLQNPHNPPGP